MAMAFEEKCMRLALNLAEKGRGKVWPNPVVGCVIAKNGKIVGIGSHKKFGENHAEVNALLKAGKKAMGSTMYVSLEPCCHLNKKTPPCTKAIVKAGIKKVFIAMKDPNPIVFGKGIAELKKAGIKVKLGLMEKEAKKLNEDYCFYIRKNLPYVVLKVAVTKNGMISWGNGKRKQISCIESQKMAYELRGKYSAVLVGIGTILKDDSMLTTHSKQHETKGFHAHHEMKNFMMNLPNPFRIVLDSKFKIPLNSKVIGTDGKCVIVCSKKANKKKMLKIVEKGAMVLILNEKNGQHETKGFHAHHEMKNFMMKIDLKELLSVLGKMQFSSVLVEGGRKILTSFLKKKLANKMLLFVSQKIVENGKLFLDENVVKKIVLKNCSTKKIGKDVLIEGYF